MRAFIRSRILSVSLFTFVLVVSFQNCGEGFQVANVISENQNSSLTTPPVVSGEKLYADNCMMCHSDIGGAPAKRGRSTVQIIDSMGSIPAMIANAQLKALTTTQIDLISAYLNPSASCKPVFSPQRVPLKVLSHTEYDNSVTDIFSYADKMSTVASFTLATKGASGFSNDTGAQVLTSLMFEKYWNAARLIGDDVIAKKAVANSAYSRIAACTIGAATIPDACYNSIIRSLTLKVWRRPVVEAGTVNEFTRLKTLLKAGSTFDIGLKDLIAALLISPKFLTISNLPSSSVAAGSAFNLDNYQLASRLSFFIWQSAPDDALLVAAQAGRLSDPVALKAQIARMVKDPKSKRLAEVLANEWIGLAKIPNLGITQVSSAVLSSMVMETRLMFENVMTDDLSFANVISADYSFMNQSLASYYGVTFTGSNPASFYRTDLSSTPRRGVLNQAAFLIATAGSTVETHPVGRGKAVANQIACEDVAPPPPNVVTTPPPNLPVNTTPMERMAMHTQNVSCNSCHRILDPYGFPLEAYNPFGQWRTTYAELGNRAIVQSGTLPSGENFNTTQSYMQILGQSSKVKTCMTKKMMAIALARAPASTDDHCTATEVGKTNLAANSTFLEFIEAIITSRQFQMQTTETP